MKPKYPIKAFDGTNTTDVQVLNVPAESVGENGEVNLNAGVKVYRALLTQTGTDAPVATVLENTLGGTVVWTRGSLGVYTGTLANAFTADKTFVNIQGELAVGDWDSGSTIKAFSITRSGASTVSVQTVVGALGGSWALADDCLVGQSVQILVNP